MSICKGKMVHKVFIDSSAAKEGSPSDFIWQPERPICVPKCRAFIDVVQMFVSRGTVKSTNQYMYVAEELPLLTVPLAARKVHLMEQAADATVTQRVVELAPAVYDGPSLASQLASALSQGSSVYTCTYSANAGLGTIEVAGITSFSESSAPAGANDVGRSSSVQDISGRHLRRARAAAPDHRGQYRDSDALPYRCIHIRLTHDRDATATQRRVCHVNLRYREEHLCRPFLDN